VVVRRLRVAIPVLLIAFGASQVASGAWIHAKALLAQALLEYAWHVTRDGGAEVRPWPWADTWPVARLSVPRLDATSIVLAGDTGRTLAFGPGHTLGSAAPGTAGTAVVSGHRDTHFAMLRDLVPGDAIEVERRDGVIVRYVVASLDVVDARDTAIEALLEPTALVLVTCWPFDAIRAGGPLRYVVTAYAAEETAEARRVASVGGFPRIGGREGLRDLLGGELVLELLGVDREGELTAAEAELEEGVRL
jgi:sortase A